jgi:argininosuccinate lyase
MQAIEGGITDEVFQVLSVDSAVESRTSFGGTAPSQVIAQVKSAKERFL